VRSQSSGGITDRSANPTHIGAEGTSVFGMCLGWTFGTTSIPRLLDHNSVGSCPSATRSVLGTGMSH